MKGKHSTLQTGMNHVVRRFVQLLLPLSLSAYSCLSLGFVIEGTVIGITDGDTITVLSADKKQHEVRLASIDAPEKSQAFGSRSKQHLSDLVFGKQVIVTWKKTSYERVVGRVTVNGLDANLVQVKDGMAWHYKAYQNEQSALGRDEYAKAEIAAREKHLGLWSDPNAIPPWDFRHGTGQASPVARIEKGETCPCGGDFSCQGPKGGNYCMTQGGKKKYQ